jgi:putative endopeptidase
MPSVVAVLAFGVAGLAACSSAPVPTPPAPNPPPEPTASASAAAVTPPRPKKPEERTTLDAVGLSAAALDRSVDPCSDFFQFACGGWEKATQIPDDKARWVRSFSEIHDRNEADLRHILEEAAKKKVKDPKTPAEQIGAFYGACMDEKAIEKAGIKPIRPLLDAVKKVKDPKSLAVALADLHRHGVWAFFDLSNGQDYKDATKMIAVVDQNGLGLPDRDYYLKDDADKKEAREKYRAHLEAMFELGGVKGAAAKKSAEDVLAFETELAKVQKSREERRDPATMYNKIDRPGLAKAMPTFPWDEYMKQIGFPQIADVSVTSPKYLEGIDALLKSQKMPIIQSYLTWQILHRAAPLLDKKFEAEDFKLLAALTGQKVQRDRFKRCIDATDSALGEALAQPFVDLRFGGESKAAAETFVHQIAAAFESRVGELDWMDPATKDKAREKLKAMAYLIGYPAKYKTYEFKIGGSYAENALAGADFAFRDKLSKVGKPVDRGEWEMTPPTVNAYYDPQKNQMVFPAGILQPPFYNAKASVAVNLGAMGMVVGHELTHGFDDEGAQFDKAGNLASWWTPSVEGTFKSKGQCVADQYSHYEVLPGVHLNGKLTLGENIADVGGMKLAFRAYRAMRASSPTEQVADGFDEDQQFFIATGQIWCAKYREQETQRLAAIDPHSHPRYRVNGPMSQLPEFAEAFQCKKGAKMIADTRCSVW